MPSPKAPISVGVAVLTLRVRPGEPLCRLIPAGRFDAPRGAMAGAGPWNLTPGAAARIIAANATRSADTGNLIAISSIVSGSMAGNQAVLTVSPLPSLVLATGTPTWARLENGDGRWVLNGPASDVVGEGVLVLLLTPGPYYHGGRIYVDSVVLSS